MPRGAQFAWPHYFHDVVTIQWLRPAMGRSERFRAATEALSKFTFAFGLLTSLLLLSRPCRVCRHWRPLDCWRSS